MSKKSKKSVNEITVYSEYYVIIEKKTQKPVCFLNPDNLNKSTNQAILYETREEAERCCSTDEYVVRKVELVGLMPFV